jgi:hypothetical protein
MERRKFFSLAPFGVLGIAALAKGETPTEPTGSVTKKAMQLTIKGPDGKEYHPLVVAKDDTTYEEVPQQKIELFSGPYERFRVSSNGLGVGTSFPNSKITFIHNGNETMSL